MISPIEWLDNRVKILDQTRLPGKVVYFETADYHDVVSAIKELKIRGAPAIGVATAYGIALGALKIRADKKEAFLTQFNTVIRAFVAARPTAVNLFKSIERMQRIVEAEDYLDSIRPMLVEVAKNIHAEEKANSRKIGEFGSELIKDNFTILTHCNTGALATAGSGTALGAIFTSSSQGKKISVIATETRPLLQGSRLTAWELTQEKIPFTLITDSAAGHFMKSGRVSCVMVGADRIAANGDTANKIGTYSLAILAHEHAIPFYVAAPTTTIDFSLQSGSEISIEERDPAEITGWLDIQFAPAGAPAVNPAFDITPAKYISAIITEKGIAQQPLPAALNSFLKEK